MAPRDRLISTDREMSKGGFRPSEARPDDLVERVQQAIGATVEGPKPGWGGLQPQHDREKKHDPRPGLQNYNSGSDKIAKSQTTRIKWYPYAIKEDVHSDLKKSVDVLCLAYGLDRRQASECSTAAVENLEKFIRDWQKASKPAAPALALPKPGQLILYRDRKGHEQLAPLGIIGFLYEVWGPWIEAKLLTRRVLRALDPSAEMALANYLRHNELPAGMNIPTRKDETDAKLAGLPVSADEMARATSTLASRKRRAALKP